MDSLALFLALMTVTMLVAAAHAWRLGNEKRDLAFLGVVGGVCGVGSAIAAVF